MSTALVLLEHFRGREIDRQKENERKRRRQTEIWTRREREIKGVKHGEEKRYIDK